MNIVFKNLGATNHTDQEREKNDYYATPPKAVCELLKHESFDNVLEPCCGEGHISNVLKEHGCSVTSSDLIDRGYGDVKDMFDIKEWNGDIVTNPPYKLAQPSIEHFLNITKEGCKIALFLKIQFLEGQARRKFFDKFPPKYVYIASKRFSCAMNGDFENYHSGAMCYAWFVWEKGFFGEPSIRWIN